MPIDKDQRPAVKKEFKVLEVLGGAGGDSPVPFQSFRNYRN